MTGASEFSRDYGGDFTKWKVQYPYNATSNVVKDIPIPPFCCKFKKKLRWSHIIDIENRTDFTHVELVRTFRPYLIDEKCLTDNVQNSQNAWINKVCVCKEFCL